MNVFAHVFFAVVARAMSASSWSTSWTTTGATPHPSDEKTKCSMFFPKESLVKNISL